MPTEPIDLNPSVRVILHAGGDSTTAVADISEHLGSPNRAVFLPYALHDWDAYTAWAQQERYDQIGVELHGLHTFDEPVRAIQEADAIIVGGGNSFRLVAAIHELRLIGPVRNAVLSGVPYYGGSAGANVACPTIRTTNDMPIIQPPSFDAFGLIPFQINPHYVDPPPPELQVGETREQRLRQFLAENDVPVIGLREGSWVRIRGSEAELRGQAGALLFRRSRDPETVLPWTDVSTLLSLAPGYDSPLPQESGGF